MKIIERDGKTYIEIQTNKTISTYGVNGFTDGNKISVENIFMCTTDPYNITNNDDMMGIESITPYFEYEGKMYVEHYNMNVNANDDWRVNYHHRGESNAELIEYLKGVSPELFI